MTGHGFIKWRGITVTGQGQKTRGAARMEPVRRGMGCMTKWQGTALTGQGWKPWGAVRAETVTGHRLTRRRGITVMGQGRKL